MLRRQPVTGGGIFDLQLAATMLANGVRRIYTFNVGSFEVFKELVVLTPDYRWKTGAVNWATAAVG